MPLPYSTGTRLHVSVKHRRRWGTVVVAIGRLDSPAMIFVAPYLLLGVHLVLNSVEGAQESKARHEPRDDAVEEPIGPWIHPQRYMIACPDYRHYALIPQYVLAPSYPDKTSV